MYLRATVFMDVYETRDFQFEVQAEGTVTVSTTWVYKILKLNWKSSAGGTSNIQPEWSWTSLNKMLGIRILVLCVKLPYTKPIKS